MPSSQDHHGLWNGVLPPPYLLRTPRAGRRRDVSGLNVCSASLLQTGTPDAELPCSSRPLSHRLYLPLPLHTPLGPEALGPLWAGKLGNCRVNWVTVHFTVQAEKPRSLALCGPLDILGLETGTVPLASEAGEAGRLRQVPKIGQSWDSPQ